MPFRVAAQSLALLEELLLGHLARIEGFHLPDELVDARVELTDLVRIRKALQPVELVLDPSDPFGQRHLSVADVEIPKCIAPGVLGIAVHRAVVFAINAVAIEITATLLLLVGLRHLVDLAVVAIDDLGVGVGRAASAAAGRLGQSSLQTAFEMLLLFLEVLAPELLVPVEDLLVAGDVLLHLLDVLGAVRAPLGEHLAVIGLCLGIAIALRLVDRLHDVGATLPAPRGPGDGVHAERLVVGELLAPLFEHLLDVAIAERVAEHGVVRAIALLPPRTEGIPVAILGLVDELLHVVAIRGVAERADVQLERARTDPRLRVRELGLAFGEQLVDPLAA
jgi:hypothetical protein